MRVIPPSPEPARPSRDAHRRPSIVYRRWSTGLVPLGQISPSSVLKCGLINHGDRVATYVPRARSARADLRKQRTGTILKIELDLVRASAEERRRRATRVSRSKNDLGRHSRGPVFTFDWR
jgi:hypothetical protein